MATRKTKKTKIDHDTEDRAKRLVSFWDEIRREPVRMARRMFPDEPRHRGYVSDTYAIANWAINEASRIRCKLNDDPRGVEIYTHACGLCIKRMHPEGAAYLPRLAE